ncbi:MAG TPA: DUF445 domain-containing protein [Gemmatimonadaceae bacterium]|nr:DUF445 domain-containing protein [Gemmatimonadaceae bacterium]
MTQPAGSTVPFTAFDEEIRAKQLRDMKIRAAALLVLAAIAFAVSHYLRAHYPWLGWVQAFSEAAMVGGLADWFAVTALFRHPMGIPIPHTAIIPSRKDRVGEVLGAFVERNFLNRDVIEQRLLEARLGERLAHFLSEPANSRAVARHAASGLVAAAESLRDDDVQGMIDAAILDRIRSAHVAPLISKGLSLMTAGNRHQELLDEGIRLAARAVGENEDIIRRRIEAETPWWIPSAVDDKILRKITKGIERTLNEVRDDPAHPLRVRFDAALKRFIDDLHTSPEVMARAEELKEELLSADAVRHFSASIWTDTKAALVRRAERAEETDVDAISTGLSKLGTAILDDRVLLERVDGWLRNGVLGLVQRYQSEVSDLIAHTVRGWDPTATSRRIELAIGRDLQFIRINGTLVGGLVGVVLYAITR